MTVFYTLAALTLTAVFCLGYTAGAHDLVWRAAAWRRHRATARRTIADLSLPDDEPAKEATP